MVNVKNLKTLKGNLKSVRPNRSKNVMATTRVILATRRRKSDPQCNHRPDGRGDRILRPGVYGDHSMRQGAALPDYYPTVAVDLIDFCAPAEGGVWIDLGSGSGGIAMALLEKLSDTVMVLLDPNVKALGRALQTARERGWHNQTVAINGRAECVPMPDSSVDAVVSRGSFYFWQDRAQGLREVWRVLRPGGRAMIGGGLGSDYPAWARHEFIQRRRLSLREKGPEAEREFMAARNPDTFQKLADQAGLPSFDIIGQGGLEPDDPAAGRGIWLRLVKN